MTEEQIKSLQSTGGDHLAATEKNILGNHLNQLWDTVKEIRNKTGGRIDFVLVGFPFRIRFQFPYAFFRITLDSNCTAIASTVSESRAFMRTLTNFLQPTS